MSEHRAVAEAGRELGLPELALQAELNLARVSSRPVGSMRRSAAGTPSSPPRSRARTQGSSWSRRSISRAPRPTSAISRAPAPARARPAAGARGGAAARGGEVLRLLAVLQAARGLLGGWRQAVAQLAARAAAPARSADGRHRTARPVVRSSPGGASGAAAAVGRALASRRPPDWRGRRNGCRSAAPGTRQCGTPGRRSRSGAPRLGQDGRPPSARTRRGRGGDPAPVPCGRVGGPPPRPARRDRRPERLPSVARRCLPRPGGGAARPGPAARPQAGAGHPVPLPSGWLVDELARRADRGDDPELRRWQELRTRLAACCGRSKARTSRG